jgi:transposase-like protein
VADLSEILESEWKKRGLKNVKTLHGMPGNSDAVCPHCQASVLKREWEENTRYGFDGVHQAWECQKCGFARIYFVEGPTVSVLHLVPSNNDKVPE